MKQSRFLLTTAPHSPFFLPFFFSFLHKTNDFGRADLVDADLKNSRQFDLGQFPHPVQCVAVEESAPAGER